MKTSGARHIRRSAVALGRPEIEVVDALSNWPAGDWFDAAPSGSAASARAALDCCEPTIANVWTAVFADTRVADRTAALVAALRLTVIEVAVAAGLNGLGETRARVMRGEWSASQ